ncbi:non-canonical purine NTP pyrophosphatase [uncultured Ilyobacter sp.]|uniref:non-canonical purine NTP pyrophosphatase n=1 Tax=uncultured Ilyobacter sp. TaxID=544433 RepID=UPI002AA8495E|nr:non-canonical purine NTP pyrophosphatase [uncultured Ilyobacter sp.]
MKEIVFVTTNKGKIASAQEYLNTTKLIPYNAELIEPRSDNIRKIAKEKVIQAYNIVNEPCIALDAGFFIKSLNGFPRAYVNHALDTIGVEGILKLMEDKTEQECEFRSCLVFYDGSHMEFFESKSSGTLSKSIRGKDSHKKWSDLWYVFIPKNFDKTLAEFSEDDFAKYQTLKEDSAIKKFAQWYEK